MKNRFHWDQWWRSPERMLQRKLHECILQVLKNSMSVLSPLLISHKLFLIHLRSFVILIKLTNNLVISSNLTYIWTEGGLVT